MKQYTGAKTVQADVMTKGAYCRYRGWSVPDDEDPTEIGYLIEYTDGGKPNHGAHEGYISWSPKAQFDNAYRPSGTWQERLLGEYEDLYGRHVLLTEFIASPGFGKVSSDGQEQLLAQHSIMSAYASTLAMRIQTAREEGLYESIDTAPFGIAPATGDN